MPPVLPPSLRRWLGACQVAARARMAAKDDAPRQRDGDVGNGVESSRVTSSQVRKRHPVALRSRRCCATEKSGFQGGAEPRTVAALEGHCKTAR